MGGIPSPSGDIVGKNRSKTTVRSKSLGPLGSNEAPLLGSHSVTFLFIYLLGANKGKKVLQMKKLFECIDQ